MRTTPQRIQRKRTPGFNLQAHSMAINGLPAVNCTRPSKWGNPFRIGDPDPEYRLRTIETNERAVELFVKYTLADPKYQAKVRRELTGKNLACYCGDNETCHCDALLKAVRQAEALGG